MSTALTSWIPLLADLKFCPNPLITSEVLKTCRKFCEKTRLWSEALTAINVVSGTTAYLLASTTGEVVAVERAELNYEAIWPISPQVKDLESGTWRTDTTSEPGHYYVTEDLKINLVEVPDTDITAGLTVWAWLKPLLTATTVPDWLWNSHADEIAQGARSKLLMKENCPWSDLKKAAVYDGAFEAHISSVAATKYTRRSPASMRDVIQARTNIDF